VDAFVAFNLNNPAFQVLFADPAVPQRVTASNQQLHETVLAQVAT
jgi:hypothetical protein